MDAIPTDTPTDPVLLEQSVEQSPSQLDAAQGPPQAVKRKRQRAAVSCAQVSRPGGDCAGLTRVSPVSKEEAQGKALSPYPLETPSDRC